MFIKNLAFDLHFDIYFGDILGRMAIVYLSVLTIFYFISSWLKSENVLRRELFWPQE